jgi:hypothetical protein
MKLIFILIGLVRNMKFEINDRNPKKLKRILAPPLPSIASLSSKKQLKTALWCNAYWLDTQD